MIILRLTMLFICYGFQQYCNNTWVPIATKIVLILKFKKSLNIIKLMLIYFWVQRIFCYLVAKYFLSIFKKAGFNMVPMGGKQVYLIK
jgi:hypothetical protein